MADWTACDVLGWGISPFWAGGYALWPAAVRRGPTG